MKTISVFTALFVLLHVGNQTYAEPVTTMADIETWIGTGQNESALVIDWNNGQDPLVWGYRYDGAVTAEAMFRDVVAGDDGLYAKIDTVGTFGLPIYGIGFDRNDNNLFSLSDNSMFGADGTTIGLPPETSIATAMDAGDDYEEGWFIGGFWAHYVADTSPYDGDAWSSGLGVSSRTIFDGSWDALSFARDFNFVEPGQPDNGITGGSTGGGSGGTGGGSVSTPEPASLLVMLICAAAAMVGYFVRRKP